MPKQLYPPVEPRLTGVLTVGGAEGGGGPSFDVYYEEFGAPGGIPAVFLHGGPGAGCSRRMAQLFDLAAYRVILFDQRGCGSSGLRPTPGSSAAAEDVVRAVLEGNTTWRLVEDMETLREHLGIRQWVVCGGSWGTTLALAYGSQHPQRVLHMVLRGVCLFREAEFDHIFGPGLTSWAGQSARGLLPAGAWEEWVRWLPEERRGSGVAVASAFLDAVMGTSAEARPPGALAALSSWSQWEMRLLSCRRQESVGTRGARGPASQEAPRQRPSAFPTYTEGKEVHHRVACDGCGMRPVLGPCYRCTVCQNYDLCAACYAWVEEAHPGGHAFERRLPPPSDLAAALPRGAEGGVVRQALLEMHYVRHRGFLEEPPRGHRPLQLLEAVRGFTFRGVLVHGTGDAVCPVENARDLAAAWPGAELLATAGGHLQWDPPNVDSFVRALDEFAAGRAG